MAVEPPEQIRIRVVYALADHQPQVQLRVPAQSTVGEAVRKSGLLERFDCEQMHAPQCAVFGKVVGLTDRLRDGDRIEILRPLQVDPKQSRRQTAAKRTAPRRR